MSHAICALVVAEPVDEELAAAVDLRPMIVHEHVTVLPIDHYFGGVGDQWAVAFRGATRLPGGVGSGCAAA